MDGLNHKLILMRLELLAACPLACVHCSAESGPGRKDEMPFREVEQLVADAAELGAQEVVFTGGEPLEHPALPASLELAHSFGLTATIYTTGVVGLERHKGVDEPLLNAVAQSVDTCVFSFYSGAPEVHDRVTTVDGSWRMAIQAVRQLRDQDVRVNWSFLPLSENAGEIVRLASLASEMSVDEIRVVRLMKQGRAARNSRLAEAAPGGFTEAVERARIENPNVLIRMGGAAGVYGADTACRAPNSELFVGVDGWITPCPGSVPRPRDEFSNCFRVGLKSAWKSSAYLKRVRSLRDAGKTCASDGCLARLADVPAAAVRPVTVQAL